MVKIYRFQRLMIIAAVIIWAVFATKIIVDGINGEKGNVVDTFCDNVYYDLSACISANGKITKNMTAATQKLLLVEMAEKLGINRYNITEDDKGMNLSQNSVNGAVQIDIVNTDSGNYLKTEVILYKGFESVESYQKILSDGFDNLGIDTQVTISMKGSVLGDMQVHDRNEMAARMLNMLGAKEVASGNIQDSYVVYAYSKAVGDSVKIGKKKININITMNYDEINNITNIQLATPVYNEDF